MRNLLSKNKFEPVSRTLNIQKEVTKFGAKNIS